MKVGTFQDKQYIYTFNNQEEFDLIYEEIFLDGIYNIEISEPKLIIDIGAHIGLATLYFKQKFPNSRIIAYEPNPFVFSLLEENMITNGITNVELIRKAVTNGSQSREFYIDELDGWYSNSGFLEKGWDGRQSLSKIIVECESFSNILQLKPDLIKIDIEGQEHSLIKKNIDLITLCPNYIIELHIGKKQNITNMMQMFSAKGFGCDITIDDQNENLVTFYAQKIDS